jgi:PAS domain S-box-containing protein/putative nucleotidyltransferase with HDIG domain
VLYAEPRAVDAEQVRRHLARHAPYIQLEVVTSDADVLAELQNEAAAGRYDVLLFDYSQGPLNALGLIKQISRHGRPLLPVVLVTGEGNEEVALQALRMGASDYVVKNAGYLYRLQGVLENAFHMAQLEYERSALQASDQRYRLLAENAQDVIFRWLKATHRHEYISPAITTISGYSPEEFYGDPDIWRRLVHPDDAGLVEKAMADVELPAGPVLIRWIARDGRLVWTEQRYTALRAAGGELQEIHGIVRDVTERRQVEMERDRLAAEKDEATRQLSESYEKTVEGWALALELRDSDTPGHSLRVADLAVKTAAALGFSPEMLGHVRRGALLHDIGKLGVPDAILQKPGPLTDAEWVIMRRHPAVGYQLLYPIEFLRPAVEIPYCHRERWDGSGYPHGLKGDEIPLAARIFAVVDVWEALNSDRPYRPAWERQRVARFLREQAGIKFDPQVVSVFLTQVVGE